MIVTYGADFSDYDYSRGMRASHVSKVYKEGIRFVTHKITEGTKFTHVHAGEVLRAAAKAGVPFLGVYIVPRTPGNGGNGSIAAQTDYALAQLNKQFPEWKNFKGWFFQVDAEHWSDSSGVYDAVAAKHAVEMCNLLEKKTGKKTVLYAPKWAYGNSIPGSQPLWASNYTGSGAPGHFKTQWARTAQENHPGWGRYSGRVPRILQYSSDATIGGQKTCDANVFDGTEADFAKMIAASTTPPKPSEPKVTPELHKVKYNSGGSKKAGVLNYWSDFDGMAIKFNSTALLMAELACYYPKVGDLYITTAIRTQRDGGYHDGVLKYNGQETAAVDFGAYSSFSKKDDGQKAMRDFAQWLESKTPGYKKIIELIHTTPYSTDDGFYVKNGSKIGSYGAATDAAHLNHVHLAMDKATVTAVVNQLRKENGIVAVPKTFKEVWQTDAIAAPRNYGDPKKNPTWRADSLLTYTAERVTDLEKKLDALTELVKKLGEEK